MRADWFLLFKNRSMAIQLFIGNRLPRKASNSSLATAISLNPCLGCNLAVFPLVAILSKSQETLVVYSRVLPLPEPIYSSLAHLIAHLSIL